MKRILIIPFLFVLPLSLLIGCKDHGAIDESQTSVNFQSAPFGFEEFDEYRVFAHYDDSISGYDVKVMILPSYRTWNRSCRAVISFNRDDRQFKIVHDGWLDTLCYDVSKDSILLPRDTIISLHYNQPVITKSRAFTMDSFTDVPFVFYDIDFDGNEELILNLYGQGQRWIDAYEVVETESDRLYSIFRKEPFTDLDDMTIIDPGNMTITTVAYEGHGEEWHNVYKIIHGATEWESPTIQHLYEDDRCYSGVGADTIPQYRRIYTHTKNDTTQWMPINPINNR